MEGEGDEIKSKQPSKIDMTLHTLQRQLFSALDSRGAGCARATPEFVVSEKRIQGRQGRQGSQGLVLG